MQKKNVFFLGPNKKSTLLDAYHYGARLYLESWNKDFSRKLV